MTLPKVTQSVRDRGGIWTQELVRISGLWVLVIFGGAKPVWVERTERALE